MSGDALREFREVQSYFRLPGIGLVEKDVYVVKAIAALAAIDAAPFALVFAGGTALARAHKLVRRMSEDVDFKMVPLPIAPVSRNALHRGLSALRKRVTTALQADGFAFDPADKNQVTVQNESRYVVYQIPYAVTEAGEGLRATIQIELTYARLRSPPVDLSVSSFVAEASGHPAEVANIACASVTETAAEKFVALTRKTAAERAGLVPNPDPVLVRHIYDLHAMREHVDLRAVAALASDIARADAEQFRNQYPAYASDIAGETRKALTALVDDPIYRDRYGSFLAAMVYGEKWEFDTAMATVANLADIAWPKS